MNNKPKGEEMATIHQLKKLCITPKAEQMKMAKNYSFCFPEEKRPSPEYLLEDVWRDALLKIEKFDKTIKGGTLEVEWTQPRPVQITWQDTLEDIYITTNPQLAIVGTVKTGLTTIKLSTCFVKRVFPQWKAFG